MATGEPDESGRKLFRFAKVVKNEGFLLGQIEMSGTNQARLLERLSKNPRTARNQGIAVKVIYGVLLAVLPIMPVLVYVQVNEALSSGILPVDTVVFVASLLLVFYFATQLVYLLILGVAFLGGVTTGEVFRFLETLPLSRNGIQRTAYFTLLRAYDVPLLAMVGALPVLMAYYTKNVGLMVACVVSSVASVVLLFGITIFVSQKFSKALGGTESSRKATTLRIFAMLGYAGVVMGTSLMINWAFSSIGRFFTWFAAVENPRAWNYLLSLIPFPFAPAYLIATSALPARAISVPLLVTSIVGVAELCVLSWVLFKKVVGVLRDVTSEQRRTRVKSGKKLKGDAEEALSRPLVVRTPVAAFRKKDLTIATRDVQTFMFLIMPMVLPLIMAFSAGEAVAGGDPRDLAVFGAIYLLYSLMGAAMLVAGLLNLEESGASALAALPVVPRQQALAKLSVVFPVIVVASSLPYLFTAPIAGWTESVTLLPLPLMGVFFTLLIFVLKVRLFGKLPFKYTVEEVNVENKVLKWLFIVLVAGGLYVGLLVTAVFLVVFADSVALFVALELVVGGAGLAISGVAFNQMFPKPRTPARTARD
ncbi:MAG: hypothetical protein Kow0069_04840 [Promethearchaeota archaeon]